MKNSSIFRLFTAIITVALLIGCIRSEQKAFDKSKSIPEGLIKFHKLHNTNVDSAYTYLSELEQWAVEQRDTIQWVEIKSTFISNYFNLRNTQAIDSFILDTKKQEKSFNKKVKKLVTGFGEVQIAMLKGNYDDALARIDTLESIAGIIDSDKYSFRLFHTKGSLLRIKDNTEEALKAFQKAEKVLEKNEFGAAAKGTLQYSIASIYYDTEQYEKTIQTLEAAYEDMQNQPFFRFHSSLNIAASYIHLKNFECAKQYMTFLEKDPLVLADSKLNRTQYQMLQGFFNHEQGFFKKSVGFYLEAYRSLKEDENSDLNSVPYATISLSNSYLKLEKYELAEKYAKITINVSKDLKNDYRLIDSYKNLSKIDSANRNYASALRYYQKATKLKDSMTSVNSKEKLTALELKFNEEKKDNEIASLKLQNSEQKLAASKNEATRIIITFLLLMALGLASLFYYRYRTKTKTNKLLQEQETSLNNALQEKELLLKEIHHRVKNNLQLIMSLLAIQGLSQEKENKVIKAFLEKGESRIRSMALIHQILYETEGVQHVNFKHYLQELVEAIKKSYPPNVSKISYTMKVSDIHFDLEQALSLGLITHEVIMNAIKHAFPEGKEGVIEVGLNKSENTVLLTIRDNGVGITPKKKRPGAIGMELVELLTEQLRGKMKVINDQGTSFSIALSV